MCVRADDGALCVKADPGVAVEERGGGREGGAQVSFPALT